MSRFGFGLTLLVLTAACASAQNAAVSGRITDISESIVPNASVALSNKNTGTRVTTTTNAEGYFVLPPQPPGQYEVSVTAPGFSEARIENVTLEVGQSKAVNIQLKPGEVRGIGNNCRQRAVGHHRSCGPRHGG